MSTATTRVGTPVDVLPQLSPDNSPTEHLVGRESGSVAGRAGWTTFYPRSRREEDEALKREIEWFNRHAQYIPPSCWF